MKISLEMIKETVEQYGFFAVVKNSSVFVYANNTDGKKVKWFEYNSYDNCYRGNNTDCLNIWLCDTRKDLTPDDLVTMFTKIESKLRVYVDPEDWQGIADVSDAYEDRRYTDMEI